MGAGRGGVLLMESSTRWCGAASAANEESNSAGAPHDRVPSSGLDAERRFAHLKSANPLSATGPLNSLHPGYGVANFHRVVVHGETAPREYLRLTITPGANGLGASAFGPLSWERIRP
jgi:hypothetical protein